MRRTEARLADGRRIVYFDRDDAPERPLHDDRPLPPAQFGSSLRYDAPLDEWVIVAGHRQGRTFLPAADDCPLCPSRPGHLTEVPAPDYDVVVFENRFPSLSADPVVHDDGLLPPAAQRPGVGRCEVVAFAPVHDASFSTLRPDQARLVLDAWVDRTRELSADPEVEHVFVFENRGEEIGVTLSHPHGQIYGYPFVPPHAARLLETERRHRERTGRHLSDDVLAAELADGRRVVAQDDHWVAFVPAAARWPFEVHLHPRRRVPDLPSLDAAALDAFADLYLDVLRRLDAVYDVPMPYIAAWHQAPAGVPPEDAALHLTVSSVRRAPGKLKYLAGSESAMGVFINDISPERAAALLRGQAPG